MGNTKGKSEFLQYAKSFITEPGFISKLKHMTMTFRTGEGWEKDAEFFQPLFLELELRRELPEHHSQFLFQWRGMIHEKRKRFSAIFESLDVGDKPASLNSEDKLFRCSFIPALKDLFLGEAIKGDV